MRTYFERKAKLRTVNNLPTMTDQSAAKDTDRNVIVQKFMQHGQIPQGRNQPIFADFTRLPRSLTGFLHQAQSVTRLRAGLPRELQDLTLDALLALTPQQLKDKLKPPAPPPAPKEEPK